MRNPEAVANKGFDTNFGGSSSTKQEFLTAVDESIAVQEDYQVAISPEIRELMGVDTLDIYQAYKPPSRLLKHVVDGVVSTAQGSLDAKVVKEPDANAILFPIIGDKQTLGLARRWNKGPRATGIMTSSVPEPISHAEMLRYSRILLGRAPSQYGLIAVGNPSSTKVYGMYVVSMEGGRPYIDFTSVGEEAGFLEVAERLTRLSGGRHNTNTEKDFTRDTSPERDDWAIWQIVYGGKRLQALGLIPHVAVEDYVDNPRILGLITRYLDTNGVSEGNFSTLQDGLVRITQSGLNKGELEYDSGTVLLKGLRPDLKGVIAWLRHGEKFKKTSVESVDNITLYAARAAVKLGIISESDFGAFMEFINSTDSVAEALVELNKDEQPSLIHIHSWLEVGAFDETQFSLTDVNSRLVPHRAFHSSCGSEPLAKYSAETGLRAELEEKKRGTNRIKFLLMPNHGLQISSPYPLGETIDRLSIAITEGNLILSAVPGR